MKRFLFVVALTLANRSLAAQQRENLWNARSWRTELTAGSVVNFATRGPWMGSSVRHSAVKRTVFGVGLSVVYEYGIETWNHQTNAGRWEDVVQRAVGQVVSEGVISLGKRLF